MPCRTYTPRHGSKVHGYAVTVTKIGRKWATLDNSSYRPLRIDVMTWWADGRGYSSPGYCYASEAEYLAEQENRKLWDRFRQQVERTYTSRFTTEQINQAANMLGIVLVEPQPT